MKQFLTILLMALVSVVLVSGCCVSTEVKNKTHEQRVAVEAYVLNFMDKGKTTQEQDQKVVRECLKTLLILDWGLNDDEEAKKLLDKMEEAEKKPDGGDGG